jgi:hypothetical protein
MEEYDRWYRNYRRRQRIAEYGGYMLAGAGIAAALFGILWLALIVFGGPG